jgi:hypothetical protein
MLGEAWNSMPSGEDNDAINKQLKNATRFCMMRISNSARQDRHLSSRSFDLSVQHVTVHSWPQEFAESFHST